MSAARTQAQFDALRRCNGLIRLDRLVLLAATGDDLAIDLRRTSAHSTELTQPGRLPNT